VKNKNRIFGENGIPEFTKVSSKGQVVIPQGIRKTMHIREGSVFAVSATKRGMLVLKKVLDPILQEDMAVLKEVEEAWKEIETGEYKKYTPQQFFKKYKGKYKG